MTVEQVARDFVSHMTDESRTLQLVTPDCQVDGGILPGSLPAREAFKLINGLTAGIPDLRFDIQHVTVNGNQATVDAVWSGTQNGPLTLPMPGMMPIPATGKHVSVKDRFVVTVQGDKVSHMTVDSPADGGIPGALAQVGAKLPPDLSR